MTVGIIILSIVLVAGGVLFFLLKGKKKETPSVEQKEEPKPKAETPIKEEVKEQEQDIVEEAPENPVQATLDMALDKFDGVVHVTKMSMTYGHLMRLSIEAYSQYLEGKSVNGLPALYAKENFPSSYDYYGKEIDEEETIMTMIGWLVAMQLSELCPTKRNELYKIGYGYGGNIYGYAFKGDPNVARIVASAIYSAMRSVCKPNIEAMRKEVGGTTLPRTLYDTWDYYSRTDVKDDQFYVDLRNFMCAAPGPYAPNYTNRARETFPDEKVSNGNLKVDVDVYNSIVKKFNLPNQDAVQAIADIECGIGHLLGTDKRNICDIENPLISYDFNAVFGESTIGLTIPTDKKVAKLIDDMRSIGSTARGILQFSGRPDLGADEYGRLRPGCSEQQENKKKSDTDDRLNVLCNFTIEDNDGCKETYSDGGTEKYYYDENGNWTSKKVQSQEEFNEVSKNTLYANSYPSGHSSGIWCAAMTLIELMPYKADLIMRAANSFAYNRAIARYHWLSDTIQGRVLATTINPVAHATQDYDKRLEEARKEIN